MTLTEEQIADLTSDISRHLESHDLFDVPDGAKYHTAANIIATDLMRCVVGPALEAANKRADEAEALWDMANPDMTWEEAKVDPAQAAFVQWDMECARHAIAAYECEMPKKCDPASDILGWREYDWPERFDRRTAEIMARRFAAMWGRPLPTAPEGE